MKVAVTGGRAYYPASWEMEAFWERFVSIGGTELHHGDATGVDRAVRDWVYWNHPEISVYKHPANWKKYKKKAGMIRNVKMMEIVDALIPFPGGLGTANCTKVARRLGRLILDGIPHVSDLSGWELYGHNSPVYLDRWNSGVPDSEGIYVIWDGYWYRRVRWKEGRWENLRGWPGVFPEPIFWKRAPGT